MSRVVYRLPKDVGMFPVDLGRPGAPEELEVSAFEANEYFAAHRARFEAEYGGSFAGPLVAAFFGRPYTPGEWPEGRGCAFMHIVAAEVGRVKKPEPASASPSSPSTTG